GIIEKETTQIGLAARDSNSECRVAAFFGRPDIDDEPEVVRNRTDQNFRHFAFLSCCPSGAAPLPKRSRGGANGAIPRRAPLRPVDVSWARGSSRPPNSHRVDDLSSSRAE